MVRCPRYIYIYITPAGCFKARLRPSEYTQTAYKQLRFGRTARDVCPEAYSLAGQISFTGKKSIRTDRRISPEQDAGSALGSERLCKKSRQARDVACVKIITPRGDVCYATSKTRPVTDGTRHENASAVRQLRRIFRTIGNRFVVTPPSLRRTCPRSYSYVNYVVLTIITFSVRLLRSRPDQRA